jgi:GDP-L-fucose synthase
MKLLITGGSGFIGRNLVEQLGPDHEILAPTHAELELTDDQAVRSYLRKNPVDVVIHAAVRPGHRNALDPSGQLYRNLRMFFNLVSNANCFNKMIFLSSGSVYDERYYQPKMTETYFGEHIPIDEAGLSKYVAAKYIAKCDNITELRVFGVFGRYEDYAIRFISNMICKALFELPLTMKQNRKFDYIYIDDLVAVIKALISYSGREKAFNVAPDEAIELKQIAELVLKIARKDLPIRVSQPGLGVEYSGDNHRLKAALPKLKFTPIKQAVEELYLWYRARQAEIKKELLLVDK